MHPETSNITIGHCLRDPVSEVGWEPPDHDLIGVLVPEKIDPHAVAVLARLSPDSVELQKCSLIDSDGIVDIDIALLPGAAPVDGTGEIHAELGEWITERLVRSRAHPGVTILVGENQQGP